MVPICSFSLIRASSFWAVSMEFSFLSGKRCIFSLLYKISLKSDSLISSDWFPLLYVRHKILAFSIPIFISGSIFIHFPVGIIPKKTLVNLTRLRLKSIWVPVRVKAVKAPINIRMIPNHENQVMIKPAMNKVIPAVVPVGPKYLSSLFDVFMFLSFRPFSCLEN
jgi:hypothetical protein